MSTEENKALVHRWFEAFNNRDTRAEEAARAPDYVAHFAGMPEPLDGQGWAAFTGSFFAGFPDARLVIDDMVSEKDRVVVRWTFQGTHGGEFMGIAPTGKPVSMTAIEINRVTDGKVAEHWAVLDQLGLLQQLGAIPAPDQTPK